jgi:hypothetical protein
MSQPETRNFRSIPNIRCFHERQLDRRSVFRLGSRRPVLSRVTENGTDQGEERVLRTEVTGRIFAYKSSCFRSATMGDEYPTTLRDGELHTWFENKLELYD